MGVSQKIVADLDARSTLPGLYAVGESSCTGLHGANRLASNSLSECFVFGARAAQAALDEPGLLASDVAKSQAADSAVVEAILTRTRGNDYGLRSIVHEVVQSPVFLNK